MNCLACGGWTFCDVARVSGQEKVVLKCIKCKAVQPITRDTPLVTKSLMDRQAARRAG